MNQTEETYYDILKVDHKASVAEIASAYHTARSAFSKDSVATYSLFNPEETKAILARLDQAYATLSNQEKRVEYDKRLKLKAAPVSQPLPRIEKEFTAPPPPSPALPVLTLENLNGSGLRSLREKRGLSIEEVARISKIPSRYIKAIENEQFDAVPARVYVQGFVKNLATLYRLDPPSAARAILASWDAQKKS